jgi:protein-S-isoprenylcysteine O-methyltransferase Ste14
MKWLELRVPPPVVTATAALLMWLIAIPFPSLDLDLPARSAVGGIFVVLGLVMGAAALFGFRKANTTINPMTPDASTALVVQGVYRLTRNPMYLALLAILIGWGYVVANVAALAMLPLFMLYLDRFQIGPEERALQARFGADYERYRGSVRRWL